MSKRTKKKGKVKNQHFVPRCLLRRFSQNDKTTSVFIIGTKTFVPTAGIKTQCAADYFYGHKQDAENALGELEGAFGRALGDLSAKTVDGMTDDDLAIVRAFVHIQAERTPHAAGVHRDTLVSMGEQLFAAIAKANQFDQAEVAAAVGAEASRFADHHMPIPGLYTVEQAMRHQTAIADLEVKFVFAEKLMVSDHPAFSINFWRDLHPRFSQWPTPGGLLTKGFMYMMPVATGCLVVVYDSATYGVGTNDSRLVRANELDVRLINGMQTINATRLLFDCNIVMPGDLESALEFRNMIRAEMGDGPLSIHSIGIPLSFLRIIDDNLYSDWDLAMLPSRIPVESLYPTSAGAG
jgi:hypothetical protein